MWTALVLIAHLEARAENPTLPPVPSPQGAPVRERATPLEGEVLETDALDVRPATWAILPDPGLEGAAESTGPSAEVAPPVESGPPEHAVDEAREREPELDAVPGGPSLDATAIGEGWFSQAFGFDVLESHDLAGYEVPVVVGVARKWKGDVVQLLIYVVDPPQMDEVGWVWTRERGHRDEVLIYFSPQLINFAGEAAGLRARKVGRLPTGLPPLASGAVDAMLLETFRPHLPGELIYEKLPDEEIGGEPCHVVVGRPADADLGFDRLELAVSKRSGVALRTVYYKDDAETRRLETQPEDVEDYAGRALPSRRKITTADGTTMTMSIRDHLPDRELRDQLFTRHTLRIRRFPKFDWQAEGPDGIDWRR